jgi:ferredoxin
MAEKYVLGYDSGKVSEPILWKLIKDFNVQVNILKASISPGLEGSLLVELHAEQNNDGENPIDKALAWLASIGVSCVSVAKRLTWDEDRCVDCGGCTGPCFSGALTMDRETWKLQVNKDKCTACGNCVKACPFGCYNLDFGE